MKYSFRNDYSELAHPKIFEALTNCSNEQNTGYGLDKHSIKAEEEIKEIFGIPKSNVFFLSGGTQANMTIISFFLKPYEGVLTVETGHINVHETASVEGSGHKIFAVQGVNGKITCEGIKKAMSINTSFHMVKLRLVYISNPTEYGTIYHKKELEEIYKLCKELDLILFIDGARLASGLTSSENDLSPKEFASLCDVFFIGGTKNGLLSGEAVVFNNSDLAKDFRYHIKNKGAMLAKGFVLGIQFEEVFKNNLFFEMGKHSNEMGDLFRNALKELNVRCYMDSPTNQIFPIFKKDVVKKIKELYGVEDNEDFGDELCIRFVFSWFTKEETVKELISDLKKILKG